MNVNCNHTANESKTSLEVITSAQPGYWITLCLAGIGFWSNSFLLFMFYKLRFFKKPQMILFWNLAIVDILTCISAIYLYTISMWHSLNFVVDVQKLTLCYMKIIPFHLFTTVSERFALSIAIDRLLSKWFIIKWLEIGKRVRWCFVVASWTWATVSVIMFYSGVSQTECVVSCLGCLNYANNWHQKVVVAIDNTANISVIIIYIVLPFATAFQLRACFKIHRKNAIILANSKLQEYQKRFLAEIRLLSAVYVLLFLFSMTIAQFFGEIIGTMNNVSIELTDISETICSIGRVLNSVCPFYLWLCVNKKFRKQFINFITCSLERKGSFNVAMQNKF